MSASSNPAVRPDRIMEMVWGYAPPIILGTAIQCRVFDLLDAGPKTVEELATASGNSVRGLRAIMNVLVGLQFLSKSSDGRYALTPESAAFLVSGKPGYLGKFAEFSGLKMIHTWLPLPEIVRTGKPSAAINQADSDQWKPWLVRDQRFVSDRTDVLVYQGEPLTKAVHIMGAPEVNLFAATTGTDSDCEGATASCVST